MSRLTKSGKPRKGWRYKNIKDKNGNTRRVLVKSKNKKRGGYIPIKDMDNNMIFTSAHGCEIDESYSIPKNVRIIMYCHQEELDICHGVDKDTWKIFWEHNNYYELLEKMVNMKNNIYKDHFCIYEYGDLINDIELEHEPNDFRSGAFTLPVNFYLDPTSNALPYNQIRSLKYNIKMISPYRKIDKSYTNVKLSTLINEFLAVGKYQNGFTMIVSTCRGECDEVDVIMKDEYKIVKNVYKNLS